MSIVSLLVVFIVVGFGLWLINTYVPMQPPFKTIMNVLAIILLLLWFLSVFGLIPAMHF